jgi:hypothetical protein
MTEVIFSLVLFKKSSDSLKLMYKTKKMEKKIFDVKPRTTVEGQSVRGNWEEGLMASRGAIVRGAIGRGAIGRGAIGRGAIGERGKWRGANGRGAIVRGANGKRQTSSKSTHMSS